MLERGSLLLVMAFFLLHLSSRHPQFVLLFFFWVTCFDRSFASSYFPYYSLLSSHLSLSSTHRRRPVGCFPSSTYFSSLLLISFALFLPLTFSSLVAPYRYRQENVRLFWFCFCFYFPSFFPFFSSSFLNEIKSIMDGTQCA